MRSFVLTALALFVIGTAAAAAVPAVPAARAPASELRLAATSTSHGVTYRRYRQQVDGIPVLRSEVVVADGSAPTVVDGTRRGLAPNTAATVTRAVARRIAEGAIGGAGVRSDMPTLAILPTGRGRLVWRAVVTRQEPRAELEVLVDARTASLVGTRDLVWRAEGLASIYDPNPIHANDGLGTLVDATDADSDLLTALRSPVTLTRLEATSDCLVGQWAWAITPAGNVCLPGRDFSAVTRADPRFEAVMAYFHVDAAQAYLQELGFTDVAAGQTTVEANAFAEDNSFFVPSTGRIELGAGGTDDGEDADVILHEYGHAILESQIPGLLNTGETGALGEGFGDYFAAAMSARAGFSAAFTPCIAEWDVAGFDPPVSDPCLRRVDTAATTADLGPGTSCAGRIHCLGQAWSGALWSLRQTIGGATMDRIVIQSHFALTPTATFYDGSRALLAADATLHAGAHATLMRRVLAERGLLDVEALDDVPAGATPLPVPGVATGQLDATTDKHDMLALDLTPGRGIIVTMNGAAANFDLRLLRPGAASASAPNAVAGGSTGPDANERFPFVADAAGRFVLDVSAVAGGGEYRIQVQVDTDADMIADELDNCPAAGNFAQQDLDRDGLGDVCDRFAADPANDVDGDGIGANLDNCPAVANAGQADWDIDAVGDGCDPSAKVTLVVSRRSGQALTLRSRMFPGDAPASAWTLTVTRRTCVAGTCRQRRVVVPRRVRLVKPGLVEARVTLPAGDYRLRARVTSPGRNRAERVLRVVIR